MDILDDIDLEGVTDAFELGLERVKGADEKALLMASLATLLRLARLGAAVEAMPLQSSLTKQSGLCDEFAGFNWKFQRIGEATETMGQDAHNVLTFHLPPVGGPIPPEQVNE